MGSITPSASRSVSHSVSLSTTPPTQSSPSAARRRRPQEFLLPDGRKILVALPEEAAALRRKYAGRGDGDDAEGAAAGFQVEVVVHGSQEHQAFLRTSQQHHSSRREALRRRFGADFDEWERVAADLDAVDAQLERLADHSASLGSNFAKFGYSAHLRTYGGDEPAPTPTPPLSRSPSTSSASIAGGADARAPWEDRANGTAPRLFRRPVIKQYFHRGLLWRASEETRVQSFELFFDLLYVGIIALNGDHASEDATGRELLRFVITFCMSWKIWTDLAQFISWFETDDIMQRLEFLFLIACLLGLTTNMLQTFSDTADTYVQLVGFYLAARLFSAAYCILIVVLLPLVRGTMICQALYIAAGAGLWVASTQVDDLPRRLPLIFCALTVDIFGSSIIVGLFRFSQRHSAGAGLGPRLARFFEFYPAINIEHKVERTNAFVTLVLGYSVVGVIYQNAGRIGLNAFLGKAVLGLVQAFIFNWLYFDVDGANIHIHAIRRHVQTAIIWQYAHLLFIMSFILSAAALSRLVIAADCADAPADSLTDVYRERSVDVVPLGLRLFYSTGLGVAMFATMLISLSHVHKYPPLCRLPKSVRLANRAAVAVVFCVLPAAGDRINSLQLVAITTVLTAWVLFFELWGCSCSDESFWGWGSGGPTECCRYTARCSKRQLQDALKSDGEVDVNVLSRGEKVGTAVFD